MAVKVLLKAVSPAQSVARMGTVCCVTQLPDQRSGRRCSSADLDNERGAVMEEWRSGKDSRGRVAEDQWKMVMHGTKV